MNLRKIHEMSTVVLYLTLEKWPHAKREPWQWRFSAMADSLSSMDRLARIESGSCSTPFGCCVVLQSAWNDDQDRRDEMHIHFYCGGWTYPRFTVRIPVADPACTTLPWETIHADLMSVLPRKNIPKLLLEFLNNPLREARDADGEIWRNAIGEMTHSAINAVTNQQYAKKVAPNDR